MTTDGLDIQKKSVLRQFTVFFIAFIFKILFYMTVSLVVNPQPQNYFVRALIVGIINPVWNVIPITYMLFEHHKAFKA